VFVVELDGIFDGDDMMVDVVVDVIDGGGQGGRLARPRRPRHQDQTAGAHDQLLQDRRRPQLLEVQQPVGDLAQGHGNAAALLEDRHAEACHIAEGKAEVRPAHLLEFPLAPLGRDTLHQRRRVFGLEDLGFEPYQVAVHPNDRWLSDRNVQVTRLPLDHRVQQLVDQQRCHRTLTYREKPPNAPPGLGYPPSRRLARPGIRAQPEPSLRKLRDYSVSLRPSS